MSYYYDYYKKLNSRKQGESGFPILLEAYCDLHKVEKTKEVETKLKSIYEDFYGDHYFLLSIINLVKDTEMKGDRLDGIANVAAIKLGRIK